MVPLKRGQELHDRSTRGQPLTDGERAELQRWYDEMDAAEARTVRIPDTGNLEAIQSEVDATLKQIAETAKRIVAIRKENRVLRQQIAELQKEYLQKRAAVA